MHTPEIPLLSTIPARREPSTQHSFSKEELIACGQGTLFGPGNAQLPVDNMLMIDRITHISAEGGAHGKGEIIAELDIQFTGQVLPEATKVVYHIHLKRVMERKLVMGIADGELSVDGKVIYTAHDLRVGLFTTAADDLG